MNIKETNAHLFDEVVVYHDGIREKDRKLINSIFKTRFIEYDYKPKARNDEVISYFSRMVYCKYECFALLDDYDEVVWSDYDVVIQKKLDEFCNISGDEFNILTSAEKVRTMLYKDILHSEIREYDIEAQGIPTPLFALSNELKGYADIHKWCYEKTGEWGEDLYLPEQCIFSLAAQEFDLKLHRFDVNDYACHPTKATGNEMIIHAYGQPKFWNGIHNDTWDRLYAGWLELGGSRYSDTRKKLKRKCMFVMTRLAGIRYKEHG